jgi:hypothetical protein
MCAQYFPCGCEVTAEGFPQEGKDGCATPSAVMYLIAQGNPYHLTQPAH